ncbi:MAG TPA: BrnA antitoxin family protein [Thermomicrobiaceae bacterium]|nr:BrnA antitoxin family protein [Thermomicrobiaceae bacterium]
MGNDEHTIRYSVDDIETLLRHGEDRTNWSLVDDQSEAELEANIDVGEEGEIDLSTIEIGIPGPKRQLTVRFDVEVIEWFKAEGPGYQTRMNAVLKRYVAAQRRHRHIKSTH